MSGWSFCQHGDAVYLSIYSLNSTQLVFPTDCWSQENQDPGTPFHDSHHLNQNIPTGWKMADGLLVYIFLMDAIQSI